LLLEHGFEHLDLHEIAGRRRWRRLDNHHLLAVGAHQLAASYAGDANNL
jgi:hypothetical protein